MKMSFSPYEIFPIAPLNSLVEVEPSVRMGALLRVEFESGVIGYGDIHPWHELGDLSLPQQLHGLCTGELTDLTRKSIGFAGIDSKARQEGVNLLAGVEIPESHVIVLEPCLVQVDHLRALSEKGYCFAKCKMGTDLEKEIQHLNKLAEVSWDFVEDKTFRLRLDFNARPGLDELQEKFLSKVSEKLREKIDFIEDPCPYEFKSWEAINKQGFTLAYDHKRDGLPIGEVAADILVYKPAIEDGTEIWEYCQMHRKKIFVTSYMDHPLGQLFAAMEAVRYRDEEKELFHGAGLLSHMVYEKNDFSELINMQGPRFMAVNGTGIGFDDVLQNRSWISVKKI